MNHLDRHQLARGAAVLGAAALVTASAALSPSPVRASAPAPSASSSAAAAAAALPAIRGADIPAEASKEPSADEWKAGKQVRPTRGNADRCKLTLVREWLRLVCTEWAGATLAAGDKEGVKMIPSGDPRNWDQKNPPKITVVTPLRRGQPKVFSFLDIESGYDSMALGEGGVMSILWREGREDPVIVIQEIQR